MLSLSGVAPLAKVQSNPCTSVAVISVTIRKPQLRPAHILRPAPNGIRPKSAPLTSTSACILPGRNREGWYCSGSGHWVGSRAIAQTLTRRVAPLGIR
ncbi:Os10g0320201 [Oryza sativa Japonica Group]|uniref:Os10g0320201 protein n=1 Tax=Oryza sativa subsp. japonica TaxID=39947 RepID=A0A0P0XSN9_ORYSJ|nr:hypothetical protein EE612_050637 [Oryza sativa]BAT10310.1 Os10g0320201 [Oryza sativa Japonica Group]